LIQYRPRLLRRAGELRFLIVLAQYRGHPKRIAPGVVDVEHKVIARHGEMSHALNRHRCPIPAMSGCHNVLNNSQAPAVVVREHGHSSRGANGCRRGVISALRRQISLAFWERHNASICTPTKSRADHEAIGEDDRHMLDRCRRPLVHL